MARAVARLRRDRLAHYAGMGAFTLLAWTLSQVVVADAAWASALRGGVLAGALWVSAEVAFDAWAGRQRRRTRAEPGDPGAAPDTHGPATDHPAGPPGP